jgi:ribose 5-phosphate isomerase RpiB
MNRNGTAPENANRQGLTWPRRVLSSSAIWVIGQDRPHPMVSTAVQALAREGFAFHEFPLEAQQLPCRWAKAVAECLARGEYQGGVLFCDDPGLVCCVANKVSGLRAVPIVTIAQAARATLSLAANLLVVEMPGRTFFEIRQILRMLAGSSTRACPDGVACTLQELDGHAHR